MSVSGDDDEDDGPPPGISDVIAPSDEPSGYGNLLPLGVGFLLFILGIVVGFPLAIVGTGFFADYADVFAALIFGVLLFLGAAGALVVANRQRIWQLLFRVSEVHLTRFADPLADTARFAAQHDVEHATESARRFARLAFARWAWVSTRRWIIASLTGLLAALAALAGTALLFQQNELLSVQIDRLEKQNGLVATQVELAEAERSASLIGEISRIADGIEQLGGGLGQEDSNAEEISDSRKLPAALRARIIAATLAARPYRYLVHTAEEPQTTALRRRTDLTFPEAMLPAAPPSGDPALLDRPQSPERGLILMLLYHSGVLDLVRLNFQGADFSGAVLTNQTIGLINLDHALLRGADFSGSFISQARYRAADLALARFRNTAIKGSNFSAVHSEEDAPEYRGSNQNFATELSGADFFQSVIRETQFEGVQALAANFDRTFLHKVSFKGASLGAATFRNAFLVDVDLREADVRSVDFDGALVLLPTALDLLEQYTAKGSFEKLRYEIEEVSFDVLNDRPAHHWPADAIVVQAKEAGLKLHRIKRVAGFN